jgi:glutamyl endopeptidase
MPTRRRSEPTGPHSPVSNQPEGEAVEVPVRRRLLSEPPSEGVGTALPQLPDDSAEPVEGHLRPESVAAERWTPPRSTLPDVGQASFGPPPPTGETVHGPDDRVQITGTAVYPWRVHASLLIPAADNSMWIGTGWFIGLHTLITAGHVVHVKNSGVPGRDGWVKSINVMPGRNGSVLPYGSITSTSFRSVTGWTETGDENYDYGAIIVPSDVGSTVGWFGFGVFPDSDLSSALGNISGYPGDKAAGTQWYDARKIASVTSQKIFYDIDTAGGQSGSAAYRVVNGARYGIAVHAYGGATTNSGTRITQPVYDNLVRWKA